MVRVLEVYKCPTCGNIVEVIHAGGGELVCCGEAMSLLEEKTADAANEKHVPVIEKIDGGYKVKVGSVAHPMEYDHYIEWVELIDGDKVYKQFLEPGHAPEAVFNVQADTQADTQTDTVTDTVTARELCNKHGLWKG